MNLEIEEYIDKNRQYPEVGVIVAKFQSTGLQEGQRNLIETVISKHKKILILLGNSPVKVGRIGPLDFYTRKLMVNASYPQILVMPVKDMPDDKAWSMGVDSQIRSVFDTETVMVYGSKDIVFPSYKGQFPITKIDPTYPIISIAKLNDQIDDKIRSTYEFRCGAVYAAFNRHNTVYATVDGAIWNEKTNEILLGHKKKDGKNLWRLPGGYLDPVRDTCFEDAVKNEVLEEVGLMGTIGEPIFIGTTLIEDWRYEKELDKIITTLFLFKYQWGNPKAGDDLDEVKWFKLEDLAGNKEKQTIKCHNIVKEHHVLIDMLLAHFEKGATK